MNYTFTTNEYWELRKHEIDEIRKKFIVIDVPNINSEHINNAITTNKNLTLNKYKIDLVNDLVNFISIHPDNNIYTKKNKLYM